MVTLVTRGEKPQGRFRERVDAARFWLEHPGVRDSVRTHRVKVLALAGMVALAWFVVIVVLRGYQIDWTGFGAFPVQKDYSAARKLWDWMQLLLVPLLLVVGGWWLTRSQKASEERSSRERAHEEVVERFFDQIAGLATTHAGSDTTQHARETAALLIRARTIPALRRLDGERKALVLMHLGELGLTQPERIADDRRFAQQGRALLDGADLSELVWTGGDLRSLVLNRVNMEGARISGADLTYTRITGSWLAGADLSAATYYLGVMTNVDLRWANLRHARLNTTRMTTVRFDHARCEGISLAETSLRSVCFTRSSLQGARLVKTVAHLPCSFDWARLTRADLNQAILAGCSFRFAGLQQADLSSADLRGADLTAANLSGANLCGCDLSKAKLSGAVLTGARLDGAILKDADLDRARVSRKQLSAAIS